jgi:hypothetical protein
MSLLENKKLFLVLGPAGKIGLKKMTRSQFCPTWSFCGASDEEIFLTKTAG